MTTKGAGGANLLQLGLVAGGGFLLYQMLRPKGVQTSPPLQAEPKPPTIPVKTQAPPTPVKTMPAEAPPTPVKTEPLLLRPADRILMRAATNRSWAGEAKSYRQSIDEWNFYRMQYQVERIAAGGVGDADPAVYSPALDDVVTPERRFADITAGEYHDLLALKGLSGLGNGYQTRMWHQAGGARY